MILNKSFDHFKNDPTVSLNFRENNIMFYINGIISKDSVLNIIFISNKNKVVFSNRGNDFYFYKEDVIISQKNNF